jgi:uncharacterized protein (TIGR00369 family)
MLPPTPSGRGPPAEGFVQLKSHYSESPFLELVDTRLEEWRDGYVRIGLELKHHHLNRAGVVHGGLLATLLDHAGGFCGVYCEDPAKRRHSMTLSLTCNFVAQARSGLLIATGELAVGGRKIYFANTEVRTQEGILLATGSSTHRYRRGSEGRDGGPVSTASHDVLVEPR